jgi:hypothetical protein
MLKQPITGYAQRVNDAVERAMGVLRTREDFTAKAKHGVVPPPRPHERRPRDL